MNHSPFHWVTSMKQCVRRCPEPPTFQEAQKGLSPGEQMPTCAVCTCQEVACKLPAKKRPARRNSKSMSPENTPVRRSSKSIEPPSPVSHTVTYATRRSKQSPALKEHAAATPFPRKLQAECPGGSPTCSFRPQRRGYYAGIPEMSGCRHCAPPKVTTTPPSPPDSSRRSPQRTIIIVSPRGPDAKAASAEIRIWHRRPQFAEVLPTETTAMDMSDESVGQVECVQTTVISNFIKTPSSPVHALRWPSRQRVTQKLTTTPRHKLPMSPTCIVCRLPSSPRESESHQQTVDKEKPEVLLAAYEIPAIEDVDTLTRMPEDQETEPDKNDGDLSSTPSTIPCEQPAENNAQAPSRDTSELNAEDYTEHTSLADLEQAWDSCDDWGPMQFQHLPTLTSDEMEDVLAIVHDTSRRMSVQVSMEPPLQEQEIDAPYEFPSPSSCKHAVAIAAAGVVTTSDANADVDTQAPSSADNREPESLIEEVAPEPEVSEVIGCRPSLLRLSSEADGRVEEPVVSFQLPSGCRRPSSGSPLSKRKSSLKDVSRVASVDFQEKSLLASPATDGWQSSGQFSIARQRSSLEELPQPNSLSFIIFRHLRVAAFGACSIIGIGVICWSTSNSSEAAVSPSVYISPRDTSINRISPKTNTLDESAGMERSKPMTVSRSHRRVSMKSNLEVIMDSIRMLLVVTLGFAIFVLSMAFWCIVGYVVWYLKAAGWPLPGIVSDRNMD